MNKLEKMNRDLVTLEEFNNVAVEVSGAAVLKKLNNKYIMPTGSYKSLREKIISLFRGITTDGLIAEDDLNEALINLDYLYDKSEKEGYQLSTALFFDLSYRIFEQALVKKDGKSIGGICAENSHNDLRNEVIIAYNSILPEYKEALSDELSDVLVDLDYIYGLTDNESLRLHQARPFTDEELAVMLGK